MVLLINPKTSKPSDYKNEFFREPNNGILLLAAVLDYYGINVEILDLEQYFHLNNRELKDLIQKRIRNHRIIGLTSLTNTFSKAKEIAQIIKKFSPQKTTIFGGPHVSFLYKSILKEEYINENLIDFICVGESERSFLRLVNLILSSNSVGKTSNLESKIKRIKGLSYMNIRGNLIFTGTENHLVDIDKLPLPARYKLETTHFLYRVANIIVNRGCPNQCSFCSRQSLFKETRIRELNNIEAEIRDIRSSVMYNFINFYDNINIFPAYFKEFCSMFKSLDFQIPWGCELRVDNITSSHAKLLKEAGCEVIATGIESASPKVLQKNFKYQDPKKVMRGLKYLKQFDIPIQAYFVLGLPGETEKTFNETLEYIKQLPFTEQDTINYFLATPYPGSRLWNEQDYFSIDIFEEDFTKYDCEHLIFETSELTKDRLNSMFKTAKKIENYFSN